MLFLNEPAGTADDQSAGLAIEPTQRHPIGLPPGSHAGKFPKVRRGVVEHYGDESSGYLIKRTPFGKFYCLHYGYSARRRKTQAVGSSYPTVLEALQTALAHYIALDDESGFKPWAELLSARVYGDDEIEVNPGEYHPLDELFGGPDSLEAKLSESELLVEKAARHMNSVHARSILEYQLAHRELIARMELEKFDSQDRQSAEPSACESKSARVEYGLYDTCVADRKMSYPEAWNEHSSAIAIEPPIHRIEP